MERVEQTEEVTNGPDLELVKAATGFFTVATFCGLIWLLSTAFRFVEWLVQTILK